MVGNLSPAADRPRRQQVSRRTLVKGAAWATPVVVASTAAPAFAVSGNVIVQFTGCAVEHYTYYYARLTFTITVVNTTIPTGTEFHMSARDEGIALGSWHGDITHYGGTLINQLEFVGGDMRCSNYPCAETLRNTTPITPGSYTLTVAVAVTGHPTTIWLAVAPVPGELNTADNLAERKVYLVGGYTSCDIPA